MIEKNFFKQKKYHINNFIKLKYEFREFYHFNLNISKKRPYKINSFMFSKTKWTDFYNFDSKITIRSVVNISYILL